MAMDVRLDLGQWEASISKTAKNLGAKESLLQKAFRVLGIANIQKHFRDEAGPGGPWAAWSPKYAVRQRRAGYRKKLQKTGFLRKSLLNPESKMISSDTLRIQSPAGYGGFHDEGTRNIPARSFMWLDDDATENMRKAILEWVSKDIT